MRSPLVFYASLVDAPTKLKPIMIAAVIKRNGSPPSWQVRPKLSESGATIGALITLPARKAFDASFSCSVMQNSAGKPCQPAKRFALAAQILLLQRMAGLEGRAAAC
jgi:hypothetical protein